MTRTVGILLTIIVILVGALMFLMGRMTAAPKAESRDQDITKNLAPAARTKIQVPKSQHETQLAAPQIKPNKQQPTNTTDVESATGPEFSERFDNVTLTYVPTKKSKRLIAYREIPISTQDDPSCTKPYTAREKIMGVEYAWDFVIDSFTTWSEKEGKQQYMIGESALPRAFQGSLHDIVQKDRQVRITKQLCGMGQVESFVAVSS